MTIQAQNSRIAVHRLTTSGQLFTIPVSADFTDGSWIPTDLALGEFGINMTDNTAFFRSTNGIIPLGIIYTAKLSLSSANILSLGTPIDIAPAPGANYYIDPISLTTEVTYGTTTYSTKLMALKIGTQTVMSDATLSTASTVSRIIKWSETNNSFGASDIPIVANTAAQIYCPGGNPTTGDGTMIVNMAYRIIKI